MKSVTKLVGGMLWGLALAAGAGAQSPDAGLVSMLQGEVTYQPEGAQAAKAMAFMKVRQGDRFTVPGGAQIRLVYFQGGRQETWRGPAAFRAGVQQSDAANGQPAQVSMLPTASIQKLSQVPELIHIARLGRSGGVVVRGGGRPPRLTTAQQGEISNARELYKKLRAQLPADDIIPELYLYSVLQDFLLYDEMKPVVEEMAKRQPTNSDVQALAAWVKNKIN